MNLRQNTSLTPKALLVAIATIVGCMGISVAYAHDTECKDSLLPVNQGIALKALAKSIAHDGEPQSAREYFDRLTYSQHKVLETLHALTDAELKDTVQNLIDYYNHGRGYLPGMTPKMPIHHPNDLERDFVHQAVSGHLAKTTIISNIWSNVASHLLVTKALLSEGEFLDDEPWTPLAHAIVEESILAEYMRRLVARYFHPKTP